jgi:hypothetical protein
MVWHVSKILFGVKWATSSGIKCSSYSMPLASERSSDLKKEEGRRRIIRLPCGTRGKWSDPVPGSAGPWPCG